VCIRIVQGRQNCYALAGQAESLFADLFGKVVWAASHALYCNLLQ
jgi:hypothetical protein